MADGQAIEQGTHTDLLAQDGAFARLVRAQASAPPSAEGFGGSSTLPTLRSIPSRVG